jgi:hypothetical protein
VKSPKTPSGRQFTALERQVLSKVITLTRNGGWFRAESSGQRVTLASLFRKGHLGRRAWRGEEGHPDAAHEYQPSVMYQSTIAKLSTNV